MHSVGKVCEDDVGLHCKNFVDTMWRWEICPRDLREFMQDRKTMMDGHKEANDDVDVVNIKGPAVSN